MRGNGEKVRLGEEEDHHQFKGRGQHEVTSTTAEHDPTFRYVIVDFQATRVILVRSGVTLYEIIFSDSSFSLLDFSEKSSCLVWPCSFP